jgi:hypothetical protein
MVPGLLIVAWVLVMADLFALSGRYRSISESEAIRLAEDFIVRNGFTDLPPDPDSRKLSHDPLLPYSTVEEELRSRHDTLERKADGAYGGAGGWMVHFRYKSNKTDPDARRAVVMDAWGRHIHMIHRMSTSLPIFQPMSRGSSDGGAPRRPACRP